MNLIVAVDRNWGIGKDGKLLYTLPGDMRFFRETTKGKVVVMGRGTLNSMPGGRPLKDRTNIVLSTCAQGEGFLAVRSLPELLAQVKQYPLEDVFVIGGASLYQSLLNYCFAAYVTKVDAAADADRFFPDLDRMNDWTLISTSEPGEHEGIQYRFCQYENKSPEPF